MIYCAHVAAFSSAIPSVLSFASSKRGLLIMRSALDGAGIDMIMLAALPHPPHLLLRTPPPLCLLIKKHSSCRCLWNTKMAFHGFSCNPVSLEIL